MLFSCGEDISSSNSTLPPDLNKDDFAYLLGTYNGKMGKLTLNEKLVQVEGKQNLSLIPSSLTTIDLSKDDTKKRETLAVNFDSSFNDGNSYRAYIDLYGDGFLHLEQINNGVYTNLGTFQPDVSSYAGSYSAYGDSSSWNIYSVLDGNFDYERGVNLAARVSGYDGVWSYEQGWSYTSRIREDNSSVFGSKIVTTLELVDSDGYGYGEEKINVVTDDDGNKTIRLVESEYNGVSNYLDPGALSGYSVFDGTKSVALSLDPDNKTLTFGDFSGTYSTKVDEHGMRVDVASNDSALSFRIGDHYIKVTNGDSTNVYPLDTVTNLVGEYSKNGDVINIVLDEESNLNVTLNGNAVNPTYVIYNNRKALSFVANDKNYIVAPDNDDNHSSILVSVDGKVSYFINESLYSSLYIDDFFAHDDENYFSLSVDENLSFVLGNKTGQFALSYWHGDKYLV